MEAGTWIALGAVAVTLASLLYNRRGHIENLSLAQIVAANSALSERVDRMEHELSEAQASLIECRQREDRYEHRELLRLRRIERLEEALRAAGVPLP